MTDELRINSLPQGRYYSRLKYQAEYNCSTFTTEWSDPIVFECKEIKIVPMIDHCVAGYGMVGSLWPDALIKSNEDYNNTGEYTLDAELLKVNGLNWADMPTYYAYGFDLVDPSIIRGRFRFDGVDGTYEFDADYFGWDNPVNAMDNKYGHTKGCYIDLEYRVDSQLYYTRLSMLVHNMDVRFEVENSNQTLLNIYNEWQWGYISSQVNPHLGFGNVEALYPWPRAVNVPFYKDGVKYTFTEDGQVNVDPTGVYDKNRTYYHYCSFIMNTHALGLQDLGNYGTHDKDLWSTATFVIHP